MFLYGSVWIPCSLPFAITSPHAVGRSAPSCPRFGYKINRIILYGSGAVEKRLAVFLLLLSNKITDFV